MADAIENNTYTLITRQLLLLKNNRKVVVVEQCYLEFRIITNYNVRFTKISIDFYISLKLSLFIE